MTKKDYKRKRSKALTKNRKVLHDPIAERETQQPNRHLLASQKVKRK